MYIGSYMVLLQYSDGTKILLDIILTPTRASMSIQRIPIFNRSRSIYYMDHYDVGVWSILYLPCKCQGIVLMKFRSDSRSVIYFVLTPNRMCTKFGDSLVFHNTSSSISPFYLSQTILERGESQLQIMSHGPKTISIL